MICKVCGKSFKNKKDLEQHKSKEVCGSVDTNKPMVCSIEYRQTESNEIVIPMKITMTLHIEKIEAMQAVSAQGTFKKTTNETTVG